jgi:hypothetical protein
LQLAFAKIILAYANSVVKCFLKIRYICIFNTKWGIAFCAIFLISIFFKKTLDKEESIWYDSKALEREMTNYLHFREQITGKKES